MNPFDFRRGWYVLRANDMSAAVRLLHARNAAVGKSVLKDGVYYCRIRSAEFERIKDCASCFEIISFNGLPEIISRYKKRPGILIGFILFVLILNLSTNFIWSMKISGGENISDEEIKEMLAEYGCHVGAFIPKLNCYKICNLCLLENDNLSWITVNMKGTTAYVELREKISPEKSSEDLTSSPPANIIALRDGVVQAVEVFGGRAAVQVGEYVKKGQLLIAGIYTDRYDNISVTRATGHVFAQTSEIIEVNIPFSSSRKFYTGECGRDISIEIFGKIFNITSKEWTNGEKYDMIKNNKPIVLFGHIELPITLKTVDYTVWKDEPVTLTESEAEKLALDVLYQKIAERFAAADIISRSTEIFFDELGCNVICEISCIEDISLSSDISG